MTATGVVRGCGRRVQGGVYAECPLSSSGRPIEDFLIDPPKVLNADLGLSPIGVRVLQMKANGPFWVFDWVGSEHYPNVADFVEETKRFGLSRRLPRTADFAKVGPDSRIVLFHARAYIESFRDLYVAIAPDGEPCPKKLTHHRWSFNDHQLGATFSEKPRSIDPTPSPPGEMCARLWWEDIIRHHADSHGEDRAVTRRLPNFWYEARTTPPEVEARHQVAAFLQLPITNLAVIRADDDSHEATFEKLAETAGVPVVVEDE